MKHNVLIATTFLACVLLAACSSGPVRRVSEPGVNIQQLTVRADGQWSVDVRIDTNPRLLEPVLNSAAKGWESQNLQILLEVERMGDGIGPPRIRAVHTW